MLPSHNTRPPIRVFVIDDDPFVCTFLQRALTPGFEVVTEENPLVALAELLDDPSYDVVLSDVQMPSASGPEILSVLQRAGSPLVQRFVFMTAAHAFDLPDGRRTLGRPILRKPLLVAELKTILRCVALEHGRPSSGALPSRTAPTAPIT